jgi:hypothetical protein
MRPAALAPLAILLVASCTSAPAPLPAGPSILAEQSHATLPAGFEVLGGPCPDPQTTTYQLQIGCNANGRVGRVYTLLQLHQQYANRSGAPQLAMPMGSVRIPGALGTTARVFLDGERIWVAAICVYCRIPSEELWIAELPLATDDDLKRLQLASNLPDSPLLRTAAAWRGALAGRAAGK